MKADVREKQMSHVLSDEEVADKKQLKVAADKAYAKYDASAKGKKSKT
jgi:hypothetical protein